MIAIKKAWEMNLKLPLSNQWESKEDLIENCCPTNGDFNIELEQPEYCSEGGIGEECVLCWNRRIEDKLESIFDKLEYSPISNNIYLDDANENALRRSLKRNGDDDIVCMDSSLIYNDIPIMIKWLQDVYAYCTELKENNKIEYVDFNTAKKWMYNNNGVAECEGVLYDITASFTIEVIESSKWILKKSDEEDNE